MTYMEQIQNLIKDIPNFPKEGVTFKDIQPLLANPLIFQHVISSLGKLVKSPPDYWVGIESRGFIFASALAMKYRAGVKLIRKPGKLPPPIITKSYDLEYGSDTIEMCPGQGTVTIVDDVYATGGTIKAAEKLVKEGGYSLLDKVALIDIGIAEDKIKSVISYA